jgi:hypothetical protein
MMSEENYRYVTYVFKSRIHIPKDEPAPEHEMISFWMEISEFFSPSEWVFRGQADAGWDISSSLERQRLRTGIPLDPTAHEVNILKQVKRVSTQYDPECRGLDSKDNLSWLALLQHYGCKTRLVDFTESLNVALYFAIRDLPCHRSHMEAEQSLFCREVSEEPPPCQRACEPVAPCQSGRRYDGASSVWAIRKSALNDKMSDLKNFHALEAPDEELFSGWLINHLNEPVDDDRERNEYLWHGTSAVFCCRPNNLNQRMIAQRGLFLAPLNMWASFQDNLTKFLGLPSKPTVCTWDELLDAVIQKKASVVKICVPQSSEQQHRVLLDHLDRMTISEATMFPGFDGYARSLNYYQGL